MGYYGTTYKGWEKHYRTFRDDKEHKPVDVPFKDWYKGFFGREGLVCGVPDQGAAVFHEFLAIVEPVFASYGVKLQYGPFINDAHLCYRLSNYYQQRDPVVKMYMADMSVDSIRLRNGDIDYLHEIFGGNLFTGLYMPSAFRYAVKSIFRANAGKTWPASYHVGRPFSNVKSLVIANQGFKNYPIERVAYCLAEELTPWEFEQLLPPQEDKWVVAETIARYHRRQH
jgi:hypothetical protein